MDTLHQIANGEEMTMDTDADADADIGVNMDHTGSDEWMPPSEHDGFLSEEETSEGSDAKGSDGYITEGSEGYIRI